MHRTVVAFTLICAFALTASEQTGGKLAVLHELAHSCPSNKKIAAYVALDEEGRLRGRKLTDARIAVVQNVATQVAVCGGHLRVVGFSSSPAASVTLFDGPLDPPGPVADPPPVAAPAAITQDRVIHLAKGAEVSLLIWRRQAARVTAAEAALLVPTGNVGPADASAPPVQVDRGCVGAAAEAIPPGQKNVEEIVLDGSASTGAPQLREQYRAAALAIAARAASSGSALRITVFAASGAGARVVFAGSFAPVSTVMVYNLAAANRLRCLATAAIDKALTTRSYETGSDVAGATAAAIAAGRASVKAGGRVTVTVLTDGCQSPARSGPNRRLTDLCGKLARGESPDRVLDGAPVEFSLGNASGVSLSMLGVGVGRFAVEASTARAERLVKFWQLVCQHAHASACVIESAVL